MKITVSMPNSLYLQVETSDHLDQIRAAFEGIARAMELASRQRPQ